MISKEVLSMEQKVVPNNDRTRIEKFYHASAPTLVLIAGLHGNEPAGMEALDQISRFLESVSKDISANVYGYIGNTKALKGNVRFLETDMNRIWTESNLKHILQKPNDELSSEDKEQKELYLLLSELFTTHHGPFYFIDLHTTSSKTLPFITLNDSLLNRRFSLLFPTAKVLGIEEFLEGPFLNYINELGYVAIGFESGQHHDPSAIEHAVSFLYLCLVYTGCLHKESIDFEFHYNRLKEASLNSVKLFEVTECHKINQGDQFEMLPGFNSFQRVRRGTLLAHHNGLPILAKKNTTLFMPLYQKQGEDGYFVIRKIPRIFLLLSVILRKIHLDSLLVLLPGVAWYSKKKEVLSVNLEIARFFTKPFFHLLGYRSRSIDQNKLILKKRERPHNNHLYEGLWWNKSFGMGSRRYP